MKSLIVIHPLHGPLGFFPNHINVCDCGEEIILFIHIFDIGVYEKGIGFAMNVLHGYLEPVKASSLRNLNL
jgi:hypothetical protein